MFITVETRATFKLPQEHGTWKKWIEVEVLPEVYDIEGVKTWGSKIQCDQCGFRFTAVEGHISQYNYCPYCGADMRKPKLQYGDTDTLQGGLMSAT